MAIQAHDASGQTEQKLVPPCLGEKITLSGVGSNSSLSWTTCGHGIGARRLGFARQVAADIAFGDAAFWYPRGWIGLHR